VTRGLAVVLTLVVLAFAIFAGWHSNQLTDYFPRDLQSQTSDCEVAPGRWERQTVQDEYEVEWFRGELSALGEPSLSRLPASKASSVRFTWLRSFHDPVVVRVDTVDGVRTLTAKQHPKGYSGDIPRDREVVRVLTDGEVPALDAVLEDTGQFERPSNACRCCADGAQWIVESADGRHGYRYRNIQSPRSGPERRLGLHLLGLTGWSFERVY